MRPDAYETDAMKKYVADFPPAAVARDQLKFAVAELSTHENQRVTKALNDGLQAALTGTKTPEQAMKDAQARGRADPEARIGSRKPQRRPAQPRRRMRDGAPQCETTAAHDAACTATIHGWLLLLPAMALLALFTHWPALATFIDSFYSTPRPRRAGALRRPRQLRGDASTTRCSGRRSANNLLVRASAPFRSRSRSRC